MVMRHQVNGLYESNRCERHTTVFNHPIPEPGTINISARCPNISGRNPNPILCERLPKSWSPLVNLILIDPASGNVEMIVTRRGCRRTQVQGIWWFWQVRQYFDFGSGPESIHPSVARADVFPITGNPTLPGRRIAPQAAYPDELSRRFIPTPVARDPLNIVPFGFVIR